MKPAVILMVLAASLLLADEPRVLTGTEAARAADQAVAMLRNGIRSSLCDTCRGRGWTLVRREVQLSRDADGRYRDPSDLPRTLQVLCSACGGSGISGDCAGTEALLRRLDGLLAAVALPAEEQARIDAARARLDVVAALADQLRSWDPPRASGSSTHSTSRLSNPGAVTRWSAVSMGAWDDDVTELVRTKSALAALHLEVLAPAELTLADAHARARTSRAWASAHPAMVYRTLSPQRVPGQEFTWAELATGKEADVQ